MTKNKGFTLIELLVVIAVIALLMAILLPALGRAREQGKRAVCFNDLKQLQFAWNMYADNNKERIACADVYYSREDMLKGPSQWTEAAGPGWYEWPHKWKPSPCDFLTTKWGADATEEDWQHAITDGSLWKYINNYKVYKCPVGDADQLVTYTMSHAMNAWCVGNQPFGPICDSGEVRLRTQIKRTAERMVFLDEGRASTGAYAIRYDEPKFHDTPPRRHGNGTALSFADGHCEYWKWVDKRTISVTTEECYENARPWGANVLDPDETKCNVDMIKLQKATWGKVGYAIPANCKE